MKLLKFSISSNFGMFKKGNNWKDNNGFNFHTYLFPHIPFVLGVIGASFGFKGYTEYQALIKTNETIKKDNILEKIKKELEKEQNKKKIDDIKISKLNKDFKIYNKFVEETQNRFNNFELDFFTYFKNKLFIGIEVNNTPIISNYYLTNTKKDGVASAKGDTYVWLNEVIENPSYSFYIYSNDENLITKIQKSLNDPFYTLKMGKNRFIINDFEVENIDNFKIIEDNKISINSNILIKEKNIDENNTFVNINETIPFSYETINHNLFEKCCISFDKEETIKINRNDNLICINIENKNVVLYKVEG